jgi:hypothetical protein
MDPGLTIDLYKTPEHKMGTEQLRQITQLQYVMLLFLW